jgi:hypothetical protein
LQHYTSKSVEPIRGYTIAMDALGSLSLSNKEVGRCSLFQSGSLHEKSEHKLKRR